MSERREVAANACSLAVVAGHEARVLPALEVLVHRRDHHDERREGVRLVRLPRVGGRDELLGVPVEGLRRAEQHVGVRQHLAELDRAVAVEVGLHVLGGEVRVGAEEAGLLHVEEVAGLLQHAAVRQRQVEGHRVLGIVGRARAGVEDDVEAAQRGHAGDDALHLLVLRVGGAVRLLQAGQDRHDGVLLLGPQLRVVEVRGLGRGRSTAASRPGTSRPMRRAPVVCSSRKVRTAVKSAVPTAAPSPAGADGVRRGRRCRRGRLASDAAGGAPLGVPASSSSPHAASGRARASGTSRSSDARDTVVHDLLAVGHHRVRAS